MQAGPEEVVERGKLCGTLAAGLGPARGSSQRWVPGRAAGRSRGAVPLVRAGDAPRHRVPSSRSQHRAFCLSGIGISAPSQGQETSCLNCHS